MKYILHKKYTIYPLGRSCDKYNAIFVGYVQAKDRVYFPVFKFDFYKFSPKECLMALDENQKCFALGHNIDELMNDFRAVFHYEGTEHKYILIGNIKISKDDFIKQAKKSEMRQDHIIRSIYNGHYNVIHHPKGGEIKYCPQCKEVKRTSCCACGCGTCYTCGYTWVCRSDLQFPFNQSKFEIKT